MENLETLIAAYLKNCETIKKLDRKTLKAYRIDLTQFQDRKSTRLNSSHSK